MEFIFSSCFSKKNSELIGFSILVLFKNSSKKEFSYFLHPPKSKVQSGFFRADPDFLSQVCGLIYFWIIINAVKNTNQLFTHKHTHTMKKSMLTLVALMSLGLMTAFGQESASRTAKPVGFYGSVINEFIFTKSSSPVRSHYSTGTELGLRFQNKVFFGLYYSSSLVPVDLWKETPDNALDLKQVHYGLSGSYVQDFGGLFYGKVGLRAAYADIKQDYQITKENGTIVNKAESRTHSIALSPDLRVGAHLNRWLDLELGGTYRANVRNQEKWDISTRDFNGWGGTLSVKARF